MCIHVDTSQQNFDLAMASCQSNKQVIQHLQTAGVTLTELIIAMAIMATLLTMAIPAFNTMVTKNRLVAQANYFLGAIYLARSEAVKRGTTVSICKSADGLTCGKSANGVTWSKGWIVFVNTDNDKPADVDTDETILRASSALPNGYTLNPNNNFTNYITYNSLGRANNIGTFVICANSDETTAKAIVIIRTRPRIAKDTDGDGIPNKSSGNIGSCETP